MGISISEEALLFLKSCLLGAGLAAVYDIFRILRLAVRSGKIVVFIEDTLYFILIALATFTFMLFFSEGQIRAYILIGEFLGWLLYYYTIGALVFRMSKAIIRAIKAVLRWLYKIFIHPFVRLFGWIGKKICKFFMNIRNKLKNQRQKAKNHLKKKKALMYNQSKHKRKRKKKGDQKDEEEVQKET